MILVERLQDGGAAERVTGQKHVVNVDSPAEGGEVELILRRTSLQSNVIKINFWIFTIASYGVI